MTDGKHSSDFERRLAAALARLAEPAPPGLLDGIQRQHRRHQRRVRFSGLAAVVVVAAGALATHAALSGTPGPGVVAPAVPSSPAPASATPSPAAPVVHAAPGTVLRGCTSADGGTLSAGWRSSTEHAGPVWFIFAGSRPTAGQDLGPLARLRQRHDSALAIAVRNGQTAVVKVAQRAAAGFRFLPRSGTEPAGGYALSDGQPGLTLGGCGQAPAGPHAPGSYAPGLTLFWQGYVSDLRGCVPVEVHTPGGAQPVRAALAVNGGHCPS